MKAAANTRAGRRRSTPQAVNLAGRLKRLRLLAQYYQFAVLQSPFGFVFWALEQRRGWVADKLANRGDRDMNVTCDSPPLKRDRQLPRILCLHRDPLGRVRGWMI